MGSQSVGGFFFFSFFFFLFFLSDSIPLSRHTESIARYSDWTLVSLRLPPSVHNKTEYRAGKESKRHNGGENWRNGMVMPSARIPAFRAQLFRLIGTAWINLIPPFSTGGAFLFSTVPALRISSSCPCLVPLWRRYPFPRKTMSSKIDLAIDARVDEN